MGKSLKGKTLDKGISQRKDGLYCARFVNKRGKRQEKCFPTLPDARNWSAKAKYADKHGKVFVPSDMTVDNWFEYWITHLYKLCDKAGIKRFCIYALCHTYTTRAIKTSMQPQVLQKLLGHTSIKTTMDRYVHVTDDFMVNAVRQFEEQQIS